MQRLKARGNVPQEVAAAPTAEATLPVTAPAETEADSQPAAAFVALSSNSELADSQPAAVTPGPSAETTAGGSDANTAGEPTSTTTAAPTEDGEGILGSAEMIENATNQDDMLVGECNSDALGEGREMKFSDASFPPSGDDSTGLF